MLVTAGVWKPSHKRPFASVGPHASFTFTNRHSPGQQVAALGPMLSTWDRFRSLKNSGTVGSRALTSRDGMSQAPGTWNFFWQKSKNCFLESDFFMNPKNFSF
jgi:hypothetical protein